MSLEKRLETVKQYLAEAEKSPEGNELYIEDLKLSVDIFTHLVNNKNDFAVMSGFSIDD
jgi:hypothetical protein